MRLAENTAFALRASERATLLIFRAEWLQTKPFRHTFGVSGATSRYTFEVVLADEANTTLRIMTTVEHSVADRPWLRAEVRIALAPIDDSPIDYQHIVIAERHGGITLVWTRTDDIRRVNAADSFGRMLPEWGRVTNYGPRLHHLGYDPTVDGMMQHIERMTRVLYVPVFVSDGGASSGWQLHPATPDGWYWSPPITELPDQFIAFLAANIPQPITAQ